MQIPSLPEKAQGSPYIYIGKGCLISIFLSIFIITSGNPISENYSMGGNISLPSTNI